MNIRFVNLLTTLVLFSLSAFVFAAPPDKCSPWPECKGDSEPEPTSTEYTAALIAGGFTFEAVDITPNNRDSGYTSTSSLDMDRPPSGSVDALVWDQVFLECSEVLGVGDIAGVTVGTDWGITQGGKKNSDTATNIRITFRTVVADNFSDADLWFALITRDSFPRSSFLPAKGQKMVYDLDTAKIYGSDVENHLSCNSGEFSLLNGEVVSLEICHKGEGGDCD